MLDRLFVQLRHGRKIVNSTGRFTLFDIGQEFRERFEVTRFLDVTGLVVDVLAEFIPRLFVEQLAGEFRG